MKRLKTIIVVILTISVFGTAGATRAGGNASMLGIGNYYDNFQNIGNSTVLCIYQDENGMMWFGTRNGIYSYNGYTLHAYISEYGSNSNVINCMLPINGNTLLLGTDKGLLSFNIPTRKFSEINTKVQDIRAMAIKGNTVWLGTYKSGLFSYDMTKRTAKPHKRGNGVVELIAAIKIVGDKLYIGAANGMYRYDGKSRWEKANAEKDYNVSSLLYDPSCGCLWLGTDGRGLCKYDFATNSIEETSLIGNEVVKGLASDGKGNLLICTDAGLYIYDKKTLAVKHVMHNSHKSSSLCNDIVWCAFLDREQNAWIGTNRGISLWTNENDIMVKPLSEITSMGYGNLFKTIVKDGNGTYWLGGENGIIKLDDPNNPTWFRNIGTVGKSLRHNFISKIYLDKDGELWIASDGGIARYSNGRGSFNYFSVRHSLAQGYDTKWSYDLYEDDYGRLWIASYLGGLYVADKRKFGNASALVEADTLLMGCPIFQLGYMGNGRLAANTSRGIVSIDIATMKVKEYGAYDDLMTIYKGAIWYTAEGKLCRIDNQGKSTEIVYDKGNANRILSFVPEHDRLWFTSSEGIFYYSSQDNAVYKYSSRPADLQTGYYDKERNMIVWGGSDCLVLQSLANVGKHGKSKRGVFITSLFANGYELAEGKDFMLRHTARGASVNLMMRASVTLELSNFTYSPNGAKEFYYKMDNDEVWTKLPAGQNQLTLAGLSGGKHVLSISNSNPEIEEHANISKFVISVPYPWYLSTLAWVVYVLIAILAIYLIILYVQRRNRLKYERKERERFLELSSLKMDFFINISHELKTPLSLIIAPLDKIIAEVKDAKAKTSLKKIHDNALRLNSLISKILDFKKIEYESEDTLITSHVDICQIVKNSIGNFSAICGQRNIKMTFASDTTQLMTNVDVLKIESIINNLLSNAVKFVANERGLVEVSLTSGKESFTLVVRDNGNGVKDKDLPFVFMRYFQSSKDKAKGSGIGLHLVKKFVELHGGTVTAHNDNGFVVTINMPITKEESIPTEEGDNTSSNNADDKKTILVIDDNKEIVDFLTETLSTNYNCLKAFDGEEGRKVTEHGKPDLVIVDQMMPNVDGMEFVRHLRHNSPTASIPIIMLTAKDDYAIEVESIRSGVDVFMSKPFDIKKLLLHIVRLLNKRETIERCQRVKEIANPDFTNREVSPNTDEALLERIALSIEKNMAKEGFNVEALADDIGVSQKQLYRKVKQLTGMTPVNYLRKLRLKKAYALLSQPGFTITEVLYMIGISNSAYFSKCFTEEFGITPKDLSNKTKMGVNTSE